MTDYDKWALLRASGYEFYVGCPRGWHYKGKWIAATVNEALEHRRRNR